MSQEPLGLPWQPTSLSGGDLCDAERWSRQDTCRTAAKATCVSARDYRQGLINIEIDIEIEDRRRWHVDNAQSEGVIDPVTSQPSVLNVCGALIYKREAR